MTPQEFAELLNYIRENNSWGAKMYEVRFELHRRAIKYVNSTFDSRDGHIYHITFHSCLPDGTKSFEIKTHQNIKEIYAWLDATVL